MITLIWPNGELTSGTTFEDVEVAIRIAQWRMYDSLEDFRSELSARALVWSGAIIPPKSTPEKFIRALHRAGMFELFEFE